MIHPALLYQDSSLFYEGHTPCTCFLILEGEVTLLKKKKKIVKVGPNSLIGLKELVQHSPSPLTANIKASSKVSVISRTSVLEFLSRKIDSSMGHLLKKMLQVD